MEINGKFPLVSVGEQFQKEDTHFIYLYGHYYVILARYVYSHIYSYIKLPSAIYSELFFFPSMNPSSFWNISPNFLLAAFNQMLVFARKQTIKHVWCSNSVFHTSGAFSQHHTAIPPCLPSLTSLLSAALGSAKPWHIYPLPSPPGLFSLPSLWSSLSFDVRLLPSPLWILAWVSLLDFLFLACHLNFFWVIVIIEPTFINSSMHCRYVIIKSFDFWAIWLLNDSNEKHASITGISPGIVSTIEASRTQMLNLVKIYDY